MKKRNLIQCIIVAVAIIFTMSCSLQEELKEKKGLAKLEAKLNEHNSQADSKMDSYSRNISDSESYISITKMSINYDNVTPDDVNYINSLSEKELDTYIQKLIEESTLTLVNSPIHS